MSRIATQFVDKAGSLSHVDRPLRLAVLAVNELTAAVIVKGRPAGRLGGKRANRYAVTRVQLADRNAAATNPMLWHALD